MWASNSRVEPRYFQIESKWSVRHTLQGDVLTGLGGNGPVTLPQDVANVLRLCNGETDFASPAFPRRYREIARALLRREVVFACPRGYLPREKPQITDVLWAVTDQCNLSCVHCYMDASEDRQGELPLPALVRLADEWAAAGVSNVSLTGGEPFLRRDIIPLLSSLYERGIAVRAMYTNGILLNEGLLRAVKNTRQQPVFHVSFDGIGQHDRMRGANGAEPATLRSIRLLVQSGFAVEVTTCVDTYGLSAISATYALMRRMGVPCWGVGRPLPLGRAKPQDIPPTDAFAHACTAVLRQWLADGKPMTLGLEAFYSERVEPGAPPAGEPPSYDPHALACSSCAHSLYLAHDGTLFPCACYGDTLLAPHFPNVYTLGWNAAVESETLQSVRGIRRCDVLAGSPECARCEHLARCKTGCRSNALLFGGDLLGKDPYCCALYAGGYKEHFAKIAVGGA